jgi:hypothetical protein
MQYAGGTVFLPADSEFASAVLTRKSARGNVTIYRDLTRGSSDNGIGTGGDDDDDDDALIITFDDPQPGADTYELEIEMAPRPRQTP